MLFLKTLFVGFAFESYLPQKKTKVEGVGRFLVLCYSFWLLIKEVNTIITIDPWPLLQIAVEYLV
eukprot:m.198405 g.198405  ORF g.198405 m.198405 type:complete len:65 (-) comp32692_c1_seq1:232-426(-)